MDGLGSIIVGLIVVFISVIWIMINNKNKNLNTEGNEWIKERIKNEGLDDDKDNVLVLCNSNTKDFLIYTNRDYVYVVNKALKKFDKIYKKDILDIDVEVYRSEKNAKRLVALTSTFDKSVVVTDVLFKVTSRGSVYVVSCMANGRNGDNQIYQNRNSVIDEVKRVKFILEDDIKRMKETNI